MLAFCPFFLLSAFCYRLFVTGFLLPDRAGACYTGKRAMIVPWCCLHPVIAQINK